MSKKPQITKDQIRNRANEKSFSRGESYYKNSAISNTVWRDNRIEACCEGSYPKLYRVWVQFDGAKIVDASCSCEYDWGGDCKHIIATLLTYLHQPERFQELLPVRDVLNQHNKEDLIEIIEQMIMAYPDLEDIIARPIPKANIPSDEPIDVQPFRRELQQALQFSGDWMDNRAEKKVYEIAQVAERFAKSGDYANAVAIYCTILEESNAQEYPTDDEGEYVVAVNHVMALLHHAIKHLDLAKDDKLRQRLLDALIGAFIWDIDFGGVNYGDEAEDMVLEIARPSDIPRIREQITEAQKQQSRNNYSSWGLEVYETFLLELDVLDNVDPEETLKRIKERGLYLLLVNKLLDWKRYDEAIANIREHLKIPYELKRALEALVIHNLTEKAIQLAEEALNKAYDNRLVEWLITMYQGLGDKEAVFRWQLQRMQTEPLQKHYIALEAISKDLGNWAIVRPQIITQLEKSRLYEVLTLIYLHEEAWDLAWETLRNFELPNQRHSRWGIVSLHFTVAQASRHVRPELALPIYIKEARNEIGKRERIFYAQAAQLLTEVRKMYQQVDKDETWKQLIADLRDEFKRLPALQDELNKAGL